MMYRYLHNVSPTTTKHRMCGVYKRAKNNISQNIHKYIYTYIYPNLSLTHTAALIAKLKLHYKIQQMAPHLLLSLPVVLRVKIMLKLCTGPFNPPPQSCYNRYRPRGLWIFSISTSSSNGRNNNTTTATAKNKYTTSDTPKRIDPSLSIYIHIPGIYLKTHSHLYLTHVSPVRCHKTKTTPERKQPTHEKNKHKHTCIPT